MKQYIYLAVILTYSLTSSGCSPSKMINANKESKYYELSPFLKQLSDYGENFARTENPPSDMPASEFLRRAADHDPEVLAKFSGFELHVQRGNPSITILVCEKRNEKLRAIQEDYSCTGELDKQLWIEAPGSPCKFTGEISVICPPEAK